MRMQTTRCLRPTTASCCQCQRLGLAYPRHGHHIACWHGTQYRCTGGRVATVSGSACAGGGAAAGGGVAVGALAGCAAGARGLAGDVQRRAACGGGRHQPAPRHPVSRPGAHAPAVWWSACHSLRPSKGQRRVKRRTWAVWGDCALATTVSVVLIEVCLDRLIRERLRKDWAGLEPVCTELVAASGVADRKPAFADFCWAHTIFWHAHLPKSLMGFTPCDILHSATHARCTGS